jgi:hypothetical protein
MARPVNMLMASQPLQWEALPDEERDRWGYERDLLSNLEGMKDDLQRKITRNESRLKQQSIPVLISSEQVPLFIQDNSTVNGIHVRPSPAAFHKFSSIPLCPLPTSIIYPRNTYTL